MNNLNIVGNLGSDCRVGNAAGTAVCNFSVAMTSGYGDKKQTHWVDCALFGRQAESSLPDYLLKGQQVAVSGELGTRQHEGKTYLTLRVNQITLCGKRDGQSSTPSQAAPARQNAPVNNPTDSDDDQIPF